MQQIIAANLDIPCSYKELQRLPVFCPHHPHRTCTLTGDFGALIQYKSVECQKLVCAITISKTNSCFRLILLITTTLITS